jgi:hypothetical protein
MSFFLFTLCVATGIFLGSLLLLDLGRRLGARRLAKEGNGAMSGLNTVEAAVFALMGLLLAFSFSGALQRFEDRRNLILQEANAISTAYDRLDLLGGEARIRLKTGLKKYLKNRLELYRRPVVFSIWDEAAVYSSVQQAKILAIKSEIWEGTVAACAQDTSHGPACSLLLQSLNSVFLAAQLRMGANEMHPPEIIYVVLFGMGLGGSLLAGFGMAAAKRRSWAHMLTFAAALAITIYVIINIEFPRLGLIGVDYFDHFLDDVYRQMQ